MKREEDKEARDKKGKGKKVNRVGQKAHKKMKDV